MAEARRTKKITNENDTNDTSLDQIVDNVWCPGTAVNKKKGECMTMVSVAISLEGIAIGEKSYSPTETVPNIGPRGQYYIQTVCINFTR